MKENKRQHILDIGKRWLQSNSVDDLRIETIAKLANVSKTTFYKHFSNKYDLIEVILGQLIQQYFDQTLSILDSSKSFESKTRLMFVLEQQIIKTMGTLTVSIYLSGNPRFEPVKRMLLENTSLEDLWRRFLTKEQQNGNINPHISVDAILYLDRKLNECFYETDFIAMFPDRVERTNVLTQYWLNGILSKR